ncbi:Fe(3+) dicitrate transport protein FecA [Tepidimonas alkaliphilus]|uniref:Fe(3+) dicitrate transport protein FecA n=1 Tax=Tepidimonas alkaliphilus TaxID=2588942 RepID=A0A554W4J4_9BURK|nr:Fe(3+) dicitrate transport protein FecA [Tepidimonas alkaliphilus]
MRLYCPLRPLAAAVLAAFPLAGWSQPDLAPSLPANQPTAEQALDEIRVIADPVADDVPSFHQQRERFLRRPGAETVVDTRHWQDKRLSNFEDAFALTPGIHAFARTDSTGGLYSIRGSDIATEGPRNGRGIRAYQDGVPLGRTEAGITNALMDMLAADYVEVYRGPNSLRFGALATGGALNFVSRTGRSFEGHGLRATVGSYGYRQVQYEYGFGAERDDVYVSVSSSRSDGYRRHDVSEYFRVTGNWGRDLGGGLNNRLYLHLGRTRDETSSTLPLATYWRDPRNPGQYAVEFDLDANFEYARLANRLVQRLDNRRRIEADAYLIWIRFDHLPSPFTGIVDRTWREHGLGVRYSGLHDLGGLEAELVGGLRYNGSHGDFFNWQHRNNGQDKGPKTMEADFRSRLIEAHGELALRLRSDLRAFFGLQLARGQRDYAEKPVPPVPACGPVVGTPPPFCQALGNQRPQPGSAASPASRSTDFDTVNPKLGINWEFSPRWFAFGSIARSFEAPTDSDVANAAGVGRRVDPQRAWTIEGGVRGGDEVLSADVTLYHMRIRGEILSECRPGIPNCAQNVAFNADRTIHNGIEAGFGARLARGLLADGDSLRIDGVWNWTDMRFDGDRRYGNNRLPVIPRHTLHVELTHRLPTGWHWGLNAHHVGSRTATYDGSGGAAFVVPGYTLWGLRLGYAPKGANWRVALDAKNLADKAYVAQFTPVPTAGTRSSPDIRPGVGRALYLSLSASF